MYWHVEGKSCCVECFQHPWLRSYVADRSTEWGDCPYCGTSNAHLISVAALNGPFSNMLQMYAASNSTRGDPLDDLIQDDWQVFSERMIDSGRATDLLDDIFMTAWGDDDGEPPVDANEFYVQAKASVDYVKRFEEFLLNAQETDTAEPEFPDALREDIWCFKQMIPAGSVFYRVRLGYSGSGAGRAKLPWAGCQIGPNPAGKRGRANRDGEIVLYCADIVDTAIAEVRPARGFLVSVAKLQTRSELRVLDLVSAATATEAYNPFLDEGYSYCLELDEFLTRFAYGVYQTVWLSASPLLSVRLLPSRSSWHGFGLEIETWSTGA